MVTNMGKVNEAFHNYYSYALLRVYFYPVEGFREKIQVQQKWNQMPSIKFVSLSVVLRAPSKFWKFISELLLELCCSRLLLV